jgi:hypothetical protein
VTVGSVNPTLTGLTPARKVSEAVVARALGQPAPGRNAGTDPTVALGLLPMRLFDQRS